MNKIVSRLFSLVAILSIVISTIGFIAFIDVNPVYAHHISGNADAKCSGGVVVYSAWASYFGGSGTRRVQWDVNITVNGVNQNYSGDWNGISGGFSLFNVSGTGNTVDINGFVKFYEWKNGSWKKVDQINYNESASGCQPTATKTATASKTLTPLPTNTATLTATNTPKPDPVKIDVCHHAGGNAGPNHNGYVIISVSIHSVEDANGAGGHGDDPLDSWPSFVFAGVLYDGHGDFPGNCGEPTATATNTLEPTATATWTPTPVVCNWLEQILLGDQCVDFTKTPTPTLEPTSTNTPIVECEEGQTLIGGECINNTATWTPEPTATSTEITGCNEGFALLDGTCVQNTPESTPTTVDNVTATATPNDPGNWKEWCYNLLKGLPGQQNPWENPQCAAEFKRAAGESTGETILLNVLYGKAGVQAGMSASK